MASVTRENSLDFIAALDCVLSWLATLIATKTLESSGESMDEAMKNAYYDLAKMLYSYGEDDAETAIKLAILKSVMFEVSSSDARAKVLVQLFTDGAAVLDVLREEFDETQE